MAIKVGLLYFLRLTSIFLDGGQLYKRKKNKYTNEQSQMFKTQHGETHSTSASVITVDRVSTLILYL